MGIGYQVSNRIRNLQEIVQGGYNRYSGIALANLPFGAATSDANEHSSIFAYTLAATSIFALGIIIWITHQLTEQAKKNESKAISVLRDELPEVGLDGLAEDSKTALQYGLKMGLFTESKVNAAQELYMQQPAPIQIGDKCRISSLSAPTRYGTLRDIYRRYDPDSTRLNEGYDRYDFALLVQPDETQGMLTLRSRSGRKFKNSGYSLLEVKLATEDEVGGRKESYNFQF